jgi:hypothetical protein
MIRYGLFIKCKYGRFSNNPRCQECFYYLCDDLEKSIQMARQISSNGGSLSVECRANIDDNKILGIDTSMVVDTITLQLYPVSSL